MGIFSKRKIININDAPEFICQTVLLICWNKEIISFMQKIYFINKYEGLLRAISVLSAYGYALFRLTESLQVNDQTLNKIFSASNKMFPDELGLRITIAYETYSDKDKELVKEVFENSYNNANKSIMKAGCNHKKIANIDIITKQFMNDLLDDMQLDDSEIEAFLKIERQKINKMFGECYIKFFNISNNIKISDSEKTYSEYIPYIKYREKIIKKPIKNDIEDVDKMQTNSLTNELSLFKNISVPCTNCNKNNEVKIWTFINCNEYPDFEEKIIKQKIFQVKCSSCGSEFIVEYPLAYYNPSKKFIIQLIPQSFSETECDEIIKATFEKISSIDKKQFIIRKVNNRDDLVEKISIFNYELNDLVVEMLKNVILMNMSTEQLNNHSALYFDRIENNKLVFIILNKDGSTSGCKLAKDEYTLYDKELNFKEVEPFSIINSQTVHNYLIE